MGTKAAWWVWKKKKRASSETAKSSSKTREGMAVGVECTFEQRTKWFYRITHSTSHTLIDLPFNPKSEKNALVLAPVLVVGASATTDSGIWFPSASNFAPAIEYRILFASGAIIVVKNMNPAPDFGLLV